MLTRISVTDFRNYREETLLLGPGVTVVHGNNGQGKTNLLEGIYVIAQGAPVRQGGAQALVREGTETAWLRARVEREGRPVDLAWELPRQGRWRAVVNGDPVRRRSDGLGYLRAVMFSPDDLAVVKGSPGGRRELLDATAALLRPAAADRQSELDRVVRQRTGLLRTWRGRGPRPATLEVWDRQLVDRGLAVLRDRLDAVRDLSPVVEAIHSQLTEGEAKVSLRYRLSWGPVLEPGEEVPAGAFARALEQAAAEERERGLCLVGPHRDDLVVGLDERDARTSASQGEARTLALSLRLALHRLATGPLGPPVLLLDDVMSELDPQRVRALLTSLPDGQVILTTAEPTELLALPPGTQRVRVEAGTLVSEGSW